MSIVKIQDTTEFNSSVSKPGELVIAGFFGNFSSVSKTTEIEFNKFADENSKNTFLYIDVVKVKGLNKQFGVTSVPTVISILDGKIIQKIIGKQDADYYYTAFLSNSLHSGSESDKGKSFPSVTVWTSDSCVWCTRVKTYLRKNRVQFREVNVSKDPSAASALQARTGQTGVPQLSIGGKYVVGFDKVKIDNYLGLSQS